MLPLYEKVALVTGASRGIGKGIAQALGTAGATVYVTGRTEDLSNATVPLPGTIHETAALVTEAGGRGIAVHCDHSDDAQVRSVFDRINTEQGRLDLLVNNAWTGYQAKQRSKKSGFHTSFWKLPPTFWDTMFMVGVRSNYVASSYAAAMMVNQQSGLIVHLTATAGEKYSENVAYGVSKAAINRMAADMAQELQAYQVTVVALCPFIVATEMLMSGRKSQVLASWMESPMFVGRAVVALASDPQINAKTGKVYHTRALARVYGFTDIDGHQPRAHPAVRDLQGKVAMQRGPIVYCIEGTDHPALPLDYIMVNPQQISSGQFQFEHRDNLLGGISILRGAATMMDESQWTGKLYRRTRPSSRPVEVTAIPYYAWSNRESGAMRVWIPSTQT